MKKLSPGYVAVVLAFLLLSCGTAGVIEINLSPRTLPDGVVGGDYWQKFTASSGSRPYKIELFGTGIIPPGLRFAQVTSTEALLEGTCQQAGTFAFQIKVTDAQNKSVVYSYSLQVIEDVTPPAFQGLTSATALSPTSVQLTWEPALDNATHQNQILYLICWSTTSGTCTQNFVVNSNTTPGASQYTVSGLSAGTTYYFVVRARDRAGNTDSNTVEKSATTP